MGKEKVKEQNYLRVIKKSNFVRREAYEELREEYLKLKQEIKTNYIPIQKIRDEIEELIENKSVSCMDIFHEGCLHGNDFVSKKNIKKFLKQLLTPEGGVSEGGRKSPKGNR